MAVPQPVEVLGRMLPPPRSMNVATTIDPASTQHFEHFVSYSASVGRRMVWLELAAMPWWLTDAMTGYGSGPYGSGPYGQAANQGDYGALRYGMGHYGNGGYA